MTEQETKIADTLLKIIETKLSSGEELSFKDIENYKGFISVCNDRNKLERVQKQDAEKALYDANKDYYKPLTDSAKMIRKSTEEVEKTIENLRSVVDKKFEVSAENLAEGILRAEESANISIQIYLNK